MLAQDSTTLVFDFFYTAAGVGKTGLTVTVDCWNPAGTEIVTAAPATEVGDGLYTYSLAGASDAAPGNYRAVAKTTDGTVDAKHIPALWVVGQAWVQNIDVAVSTRSTNAGAATASAAAILANPAHLLFTDASGFVTVGTNADKTGYTLTVTPPTASTIATACAAAILATPSHQLVTDASGFVTVGTNNDKSGYTLTVTPPTASMIATACAAAILITPAYRLATDASGFVTDSGSASDPWTTDVVAGAYTGTQAGALMSSWSKLYVLTAVLDGAPSATAFKLGSGASTNDGAYVGQSLLFLTGLRAGERRQIIGYTGATKLAVFGAAFSAPPVNSDVCEIQ